MEARYSVTGSVEIPFDPIGKSFLVVCNMLILQTFTSFVNAVMFTFHSDLSALVYAMLDADQGNASFFRVERATRYTAGSRDTYLSQHRALPASFVSLFVLLMLMLSVYTYRSLEVHFYSFRLYLVAHTLLSHSFDCIPPHRSLLLKSIDGSADSFILRNERTHT